MDKEHHFFRASYTEPAVPGQQYLYFSVCLSLSLRLCMCLSLFLSVTFSFPLSFSLSLFISLFYSLFFPLPFLSLSFFLCFFLSAQPIFKTRSTLNSDTFGMVPLKLSAFLLGPVCFVDYFYHLFASIHILYQDGFGLGVNRSNIQ